MSGLEFVALALATPDAIQKLIALGKDVSARVRAVKDASSMMGDLSVFDREPLLRAQFEAGRAFCENSDMDDWMQKKLNESFIDIQLLLSEVQNYVSKVEKYSKSRRFWAKDEPKKRLVDSSTRLRTLLSDFTDIVQLTSIKTIQPSHLQLSDADFQWTFAPLRPALGPNIYCLEGELVRNRHGIDPRRGSFLCERHPYKPGDKSSLEARLRHLSEKLCLLKPGGGTLAFVGFKDNVDEGCFDLVFDLPSGTAINQTLADVLHVHKEKPSLNIRINLCKQVASAIFQVHSVGMVHKSVRSQNMLFFPGIGADIGNDCRVFLTNWRMLRRADAATQRLPEQDPLMGIYQHPSRQGVNVEENYNMSHDIYSLGVFMMEVLLWMPFVTTSSGKQTTLSEDFTSELAHLGMSPAELMVEKRSPAGGYEPHSDEESDGSEEDDLDSQEEYPNPHKIESTLICLAQSRIPAVAGERLSRLVLNCLMVSENGFGTRSLVKQDAIETGLNYLTAVEGVLEEIRI